MIATRTAELLRNLRGGTLDPADVAVLEATPANELIDDLRREYRVTYQERRIGRKWEVSLARSFRPELAVRPIPDALFVSFSVVPAYRGCLTLNAEGDSVTGISWLSRLSARTVSKPERGLALKTGHGFKLDRAPDGWAIKPMHRRVVKLSEPFLRGRGWQFDHLKQFFPGA
jgi:hypothetical protein